MCCWVVKFWNVCLKFCLKSFSTMARDHSEVSLCVKYLLFFFNVFFWVSNFSNPINFVMKLSRQMCCDLLDAYLWKNSLIFIVTINWLKTFKVTYQQFALKKATILDTTTGLGIFISFRAEGYNLTVCSGRNSPLLNYVRYWNLWQPQLSINNAWSICYFLQNKAQYMFNRSINFEGEKFQVCSLQRQSGMWNKHHGHWLLNTFIDNNIIIIVIM